SKATDPAHGSVVVNGDGTYTYTPATGYDGADSFTYTVSDGNGGSNTYTVAVTVNPVNHAPTASGTAITTSEDTAKSGSLPGATDIDGDTVTYGKATDPAHGSVVVNADGTYTYTPAANYHGADSFSYTVSDGHGGSNTYTVAVTVNPVNDAPTASGTAITTDEDTPRSGSLPGATDADGDTVTYGKASDPAHGTVTIDAQGAYTYTPAANYHGTDSFTYTVSDGKGGSNTYTVSVTVDAVNDAPVASNTSITTPEDTPRTGTLPGATDADGDTPVYGKGTDPAHGTVVVNADGTYTYTPAANYHGADSFTYTVGDGKGGSNTYTVSITVDAVNDAPVAADVNLSTPGNTPRTGTLPAATDVDGDTPVYAKGSDPAHGSVVIDAKGNYTYTPGGDFSGNDSFTYTVSDGKGGSNTYTVTIAVGPVNGAPEARDASVTTAEDKPATGVLPAATDKDGDTVVYGKGSDPAHGSVVIDAAGNYTYTPARDFHGTDSFTYTVSDGKGGSNTYTVQVTVAPVNDAPVAGDAAIATNEDVPATGTLPRASDADGDTVVYGKGADPAHGTVVIDAAGNYTYTPVRDFHGTDSFSYTVSDGNGGSNTYTVQVTVAPVNDAPVAHGGASGAGNVGAPLAPVTVPAFSDVDSPTIAYTATLADGVPLPSWLGFDPDTRTFTGTPPQGSQGSYTVRVTGSDGQSSADVVVTITIGNAAAPTQSVSIDSMTKDTGASATDFVTGDGSAGRTVAGGIGAPLGAGQAVQVSFDGGATWSTAAVSGTRWTSVDGGAHAAGWTISARVVDTATGLSGPVAAQPVTLETSPASPVAPTVDSVPNDNATPVLGGTATVGAGEHLEVRVGDTTYVVPVRNGTWTLDLSTAEPVSGKPVVLEPGRDYEVVASVTDATGNVRNGSNTGNLNVGLPVVPADVPPPPRPEPSVPAAPVPALATVPAPAPAPGEADHGTGVRSETSAPGSLAAGDTQQLGSGIGTRAAENSFADALRGAALSDVYTRSEGFRTVVAKAEEPALVLFQGVPDQFVETASRLSVTIPADAFAHTQPAAIVRLTAVLQDGRPLPSWVEFNGQTGQFTGEVPRDFKGELKVKLVARDMAGREATALFRINVGTGHAVDNGSPARAGKPGLTSQLRAAPARFLPGRG
ncbi:tandem-95 repeat protein, partial [uncultured Massilia sp.]|uniref:tandem-95 repeat protein n=1 Tax=uncultured Massilia sp. TaxID=169973 RepID=UPI0025D980A3